MSVKDSLEGTSPHISDRYITREIAGAAITMGQLVQQSANQTVVPSPNAPTTARCGIAITSAAINKAVSVLWRGRARATAYGTINAGDWVGPASGSSAIGCVQTVAAPSLTISAGTALVSYLAQLMNIFASCEIGASSGGSAVILID